LAAAGARLAAVGAKPPAGETKTVAGVPVFRHDYGDSPEQFVEVYGDPATASATVVFVHGGYFRPRTDLSHARPLAVSLAESGVLVALVEYRRAGGQPHALDDVTAAIASLRAELPGWGLGRRARAHLIVAAHSAGGGPRPPLCRRPSPRAGPNCPGGASVGGRGRPASCPGIRPAAASCSAGPVTCPRRDRGSGCGRWHR